MFPFANVESMSSGAVLATCQAMLKVAAVDDLLPAEIELIRNFYQGFGESGLPAFEVLLEKAPGDLHIDRHALENDAQKELLLALCVITGFADGALSAEELVTIQGIADDLGIPADKLSDAIAKVKDFMLSQLTHLPDAGSVAIVAKELG